MTSETSLVNVQEQFSLVVVLESNTVHCALLLLFCFAKENRASNTSPEMAAKVANKPSVLPYSTAEEKKVNKRVIS